MVHKVVLITGANRGIGLEFARQIAITPVPPLDILKESCDSFSIVALTRSLPAEDLEALKNDVEQLNNQAGIIKRQLHILQCDVTRDEEIEKVKEFVTQKLGGRMDLFICNAGMSESKFGYVASDLNSNADTHPVEIMKVNAISPMVLTNVFAPLLQAAADSLMTDDEKKNFAPQEYDSTVDAGVDVLKLDEKDKLKQYAQCVYISSTLGSIAAANSNYAPTYRASKAALSMYVKTLAYQYPAINMLLVSPGWVQTRMGSSGGRAPPLTPQQSITGMIEQMNKYRSRQDSANAIIDYDGSIVPW